jgi:hypothetical protein
VHGPHAIRRARGRCVERAVAPTSRLPLSHRRPRLFVTSTLSRIPPRPAGRVSLQVSPVMPSRFPAQVWAAVSGSEITTADDVTQFGLHPFALSAQRSHVGFGPVTHTCRWGQSCSSHRALQWRWVTNTF